MLTPEQIDKAYRDVWSTVPHAGRLTAFARAIEAEVRKEDEALIRKMLEAMINAQLDAQYGNAYGRCDTSKFDAQITAARARLLDSDLSRLTERGKEAWKGVDPQKLRETGAL